MCLITKQKKAKIAKKDITVYKELRILQNGLYSWIQNFKYEIGKKYTTRLSPRKAAGLTGNDFRIWDSTVNEFYFNGKFSKKIIINRKDLILIQEGFHSFKTKERDYYNTVCIIPKGSEYFEDATGLIVSNQIIIKEIITN